jgi:predicted HTH domain antitoxin
MNENEHSVVMFSKRYRMDLAIKIPAQVYEALRIPAAEREETLRLELALALYQRDILSFGKARELAGLSKWDFDALLGKRQILRHYDLENLEEDLHYIKTY